MSLLSPLARTATSSSKPRSFIPHFACAALPTRAALPARVALPACIALIAASLAGCSVRGSGVIEEVDHDVTAFTRIDVEDGFDLTIISGTEFRVTTKSDDNLSDRVVVTQEGNQVKIGLKENTSTRRSTFEAIVVLPDLDELEVEDGCNAEGTNLAADGNVKISIADGSGASLSFAPSASIDRLELDVEDGSDLDLDTIAASVVLEVEDGSSVRLTGEADDASYLLRDGSDLSARAFAVVNVDVDFSGGSSASISATNQVNGAIKDGSDLEVSGGATVNVSTSGGSDLDIN